MEPGAAAGSGSAAGTGGTGGTGGAGGEVDWRLHLTFDFDSNKTFFFS